jgi:hypothetical protein
MFQPPELKFFNLLAGHGFDVLLKKQFYLPLFGIFMQVA